MAESKIYKNKNGYLSIEAFLTLIHSGEIDQWMRKHTVTHSPCPPRELIALDPMCFNCVSCQRDCISQVKDYKNYYEVKKKKYMKSDLETKGE